MQPQIYNSLLTHYLCCCDNFRCDKDKDKDKEIYFRSLRPIERTCKHSDKI